MQPLINQIHTLLIKKQKTIAAAESCTGGLLSEFLTRTPGCSKYFILGVVTYSNTTKQTILKIPQSVILNYGAVSDKTARRMAQKIREMGKTDLGIGITGIAGPAGAVMDKPVGTVFIAIDAKTKKICRKFIFKGSRAAIRKQAALKSLKLLKQLIK